jgi:membrane-associated phospholipid phosphatase
MKFLFKAISIVFHPVLIPMYVCLCMFNLCPQLFVNIDAKTIINWKLQLGFNTILYPVLVTVLMWKLGFAKDIFLRTTQERLGPLMASILFYFWNFYVFHKLTAAPILFKSFLLGTFFTISLLFFISIFVKISMHAAAMGGALMALILLALKTPCVNWWPAIIAFICSLLVIIARLIFKDHTKAEIVLGYSVGIICQLLVWIFYA